MTTSDLPRAELDLGPASERFAGDFGELDTGFVLEAAQTAELVVRAIARSDGTRASVLEELIASRVKDGLLGSFRFDQNGDVTPATVADPSHHGIDPAAAPVFQATYRAPSSTASSRSRGGWSAEPHPLSLIRGAASAPACPLCRSSFIRSMSTFAAALPSRPAPRRARAGPRSGAPTGTLRSRAAPS